MIESINSAQPNRSDTIINSVIGAGSGFVVGGSVGYLTKSILKEGNISDRFIRTVRDNYILEQTDGNKEFLEIAKGYLDADENMSISTMRDLSRRLQLSIAETPEEYAKAQMIDFDAIPEAIIKSDFYKRKSDIGLLNNEVTDVLSKFYDAKDKKLFSMHSFHKTGEYAGKKIYGNDLSLLLEVAKTVEKNFRGKAALLWGVVSGAIVGTGAYITTKCVNKK